ncbi:MAG TPA: hypothetical protein VHC47_09425 [Mucilaginibacter sp.]|nr:hypothetical protein [Mucilaginibacter sp.]
MPFLHMLFRRPILLSAASIVTLSCHKEYKTEITTAFDAYFEILHGKVKQLQEFYRQEKGDPGETETNDFDIHGNLMQTRRAGISNAVIKYEYVYGPDGKKTAVMTIAVEEQVPVIYKYDTNGRIVLEVWNARVLDPAQYGAKNNAIFKYDAAGNRIEEIYSSKDYSYRIQYKYDDKRLLIEEEYFNGDVKKPVNKTTYHYTAFDAKGNWLRRIGQVEDYGSVVRQEIHRPIVVRKISYY